MNLNALESKFFNRILNAELGVPVHATLEYQTETFPIIIVPELDPDGPSYLRDIAALKYPLTHQQAGSSTIKVKRQLWQNLLTAALGEIAGTPAQLDDLFVRHTYLTAVIGMVVQASFGSDIYQLAANDPADLLYGREFRNKTGLQGVVESDFFTNGLPPGRRPALARDSSPQRRQVRLAEVPPTISPPSSTRPSSRPTSAGQLGEYYTPDWLARAISAGGGNRRR